MKSRDGKRLKVEESRRRRELLRKDEMLERERETSFRVKPSIRDDRDEVVRRERVHHWYGESHVVILLGVTLTENELIVEENDLSVDVLDENPERFCSTVNLLLPLEVGGDREFDS